MSDITPSQTVGPYFAYGLTPAGRICVVGCWSVNNLVTPDVAGERIRIEGRVTDGDGEPIHDAMIEIWQADCARALSASARQPDAAEYVVQGFWPRRHRSQWRFSASTPSNPARFPVPTARRRRRTSSSAYFSRGMLPHMYTRIYFRRRGGQRLRSDPRARSRRSPRHADREKRNARRSGGVSLRHPGPGQGRDRFLRSLTGGASLVPASFWCPLRIARDLTSVRDGPSGKCRRALLYTGGIRCRRYSGLSGG